jgi:tRNA (guanine37-N1)-methyltransferase
VKKPIWIITLFPDYFSPLTTWGVVSGLFQERWELKLVNLRDYAFDHYKSVDDTPYGGGPGMILRPDVLENALKKGVILPGGYGENYKEKITVINFSPVGTSWDHPQAKKLAQEYFSSAPTKDLVFICGRYEGIDQRFIDLYVDREICVGDYILSGGEIAALAILDSSLRLVEGALGNVDSHQRESFETPALEYPQYTRPAVFEGLPVPEVLTSGHHAKIEEWRREMSEKFTQQKRPDLWARYRGPKGGQGG